MTELLTLLAPGLGESSDVRALYYRTSRQNDRLIPLSRTSFSIAAGSEITFETYFNAFPAAYFRRWTSLKHVVLTIEYQGSGRIDVFRSKSDASRIAVVGRTLDSASAETLQLEVDLGPFEDGGWLWFDLTATSDVTITKASWCAPKDAPRRSCGRASIGFPTFNRPDYAGKTLTDLHSDPRLVNLIDGIYVVDQGSNTLSSHPLFPQVKKLWGDKLNIVSQANYGGSGGYARVLYEALHHSDSEFIIFMDDDVIIEPECIVRAISFAWYTTEPTLVGAHMLNLQERSHLHSLGEKIDPGAFMWTAASDVDYDFDLGSIPFRDMDQAKGLHRRVDVEFNGWWTCLIPREVPEKIGFPLPLFLKWDDVEFGLRAAKAGYSTATIPGIAVWHMAWTDKDDAIDWQAYFHLRNRLVVAALYHDGDCKGIFANAMKALLKHLLCLEYSTIVIQMRAIDDFLAGPENLFALLGTALGEVNAIRGAYPDAQLLPSAALLPRSSQQTAAFGKREPHGAVQKLRILASAIRVNLRAENPVNHEVPQANFTPLEARWYSLGRSDGVTVTAADSRGVYFRKRSRKTMFRLLIQSSIKHVKLYRSFEQKKQDYRRAHNELISTAAWEKKFHE